MKQKIFLAYFFSSVISSASLANSEHYTSEKFPDSSNQLSPCIDACLKKDMELHRQTIDTKKILEVLQEAEESCLLNDYKLHVQTLGIFMGYGRSKDYILNKLGSFLSENSHAMIECLYAEILVKINKDSETTQDCLAKCSDSDFTFSL